MLDNSIAGGITAGETPFECLVRESTEEAALPEELVRRSAHAAGTLSWFSIEDERAGFEPGFLHPGVQYVYDLEVPETVELKPSEEEHKEFNLWDVSEVMGTIHNKEYKPSCALVLIDFLIRHGFITAENEPNFAEIISRIHRKLPFSTKEPATCGTFEYNNDGHTLDH
jgi:8-oxo-dGTP pyrophosphatase MutT (NUDIX family)